VQFRIDNTSAVAWQNKLALRNPRAESIIRLLSLWELEFGLHLLATHVAGVGNRIADAGSRSHSSPSMATLFAELKSGWLQVDTTMNVQGLEAIWRSTSERALSQHPRSPNTASP
jgi:hypothetical protein